jgi:hypothetical protein
MTRVLVWLGVLRDPRTVDLMFRPEFTWLLDRPVTR